MYVYRTMYVRYSSLHSRLQTKLLYSLTLVGMLIEYFWVWSRTTHTRMDAYTTPPGDCQPTLTLLEIEKGMSISSQDCCSTQP